MFIFGNLLLAVAQILDIILSIYMWIIIIAALISWVNPDPYNPIVRFLYSVTDPVLTPIRRRIKIGFGGIGISPLIVILIILFIRRFLIASLILIIILIKAQTNSKPTLFAITYFFGIGIGYIMLQLFFVSMLDLLISNPTISTILVLFTYLLFNAVGCLISQNFNTKYLQRTFTIFNFVIFSSIFLASI